jgi:hypothetical protein
VLQVFKENLVHLVQKEQEVQEVIEESRVPLDLWVLLDLKGCKEAEDHLDQVVLLVCPVPLERQVQQALWVQKAQLVQRVTKGNQDQRDILEKLELWDCKEKMAAKVTEVRTALQDPLVQEV